MKIVRENSQLSQFLYFAQAPHLQLNLRSFLFGAVMIQEDYHSQNPYHNAVHAADVTQAMHCYLKEPKVRC